MHDAPIKTEIKNGRHPKSRCPKCGSKKVKKLIARPEIVFTGSGWGRDKK